MGSNYPDNVTQASFDHYWNDKLDDDEEPGDDGSPLDEPLDFDFDFERGYQ